MLLAHRLRILAQPIARPIIRSAAARVPPRTSLAIRAMCTNPGDKAREAARLAIANAERAAGELAAAQASVDADQSPSDSAANDDETSSAHSAERKAPPRFPIGASVECRLGEGKWATGLVVGHWWKEPSWPADKRAPYQIRLDVEGCKPMLIYAPADVDECIRSALRFEVGAAVECNLGNGEWAEGKVVARYHREPSWPSGEWAPYQVSLHGKGVVWAPQDTDECIRASGSSS